jgi:hypothetical protein
MENCWLLKLVVLHKVTTIQNFTRQFPTVHYTILQYSTQQNFSRGFRLFFCKTHINLCIQIISLLQISRIKFVTFTSVWCMLHNPQIFHKLFTMPKPFAKLRRMLLNMTDRRTDRQTDSFITSHNSARWNFRALSGRNCVQNSGPQFSQKSERIKEGLEQRALCCV